MKKLYIIIIVALVIIFALIYFSVFGIQTISIDKKIYSVGEEVKIHWSDLSLKWCTCSNKGIQIFRQGTAGWESAQYQLYGFGGGACVNGGIVSLPMPCDVVSCSFPRLNFNSGDFLWNSKIYERKGSVDSCLDRYSNEIINRKMQSYEFKNAPPGKYKIQFGNLNKVIEIR